METLFVFLLEAANLHITQNMKIPVLRFVGNFSMVFILIDPNELNCSGINCVVISALA